MLTSQLVVLLVINMLMLNTRVIVKKINQYAKYPKVKYHHGVKSMRAPFVMYADLESLLKKLDTCINDPEKSSTTKINKHETCGYSLITHCSFDEKKE